MNNSSPLTVCMFSNLYPPIFSGSSTQCSQLAGELARRGCKVIVITSRVDPGSPEFEVVDGVSTYRIPCLVLPKMPIALNFPWLNITFSPANIKRILEILQSHSPDVIHVHNHMLDLAFHAVVMARRLKIPLVITIHTIIKHVNPFYDAILHFIDKFLLKPLVVQQADILICPDQIYIEYVSRVFGPARTTLIPPGIRKLSNPDPRKMLIMRDKHDIGEGPVILSLGHLHETRNRKELIGILPQLLQRFPKLKVLIVGYVGTHSANKLATKLGVQDHIIFTGAVPYSDIPDYFGMADIEAHWFDREHPHKTLGIAAQEAMAAGKVVFGNADENVYGKGLLKSGENVILIDPKDSATLVRRITELLLDDAKRKLIGNNARVLMEQHFSWSAVGEQTLAAYHSIQAT